MIWHFCCGRHETDFPCPHGCPQCGQLVRGATGGSSGERGPGVGRAARDCRKVAVDTPRLSTDSTSMRLRRAPERVPWARDWPVGGWSRYLGALHSRGRATGTVACIETADPCGQSVSGTPPTRTCRIGTTLGLDDVLTRAGVTQLAPTGSIVTLRASLHQGTRKRLWP